MANRDTVLGWIRNDMERRHFPWLAPCDLVALRRCAMTLHRWAEAECGDGRRDVSWCITRDDATGKPFREVHSRAGVQRYAVADREKGALKRLAAICARYGLHYYHQTDPRGASVYVAMEPLTASTYLNGVAIYR